MTWPQQIPRRLLSALHLISDRPLRREAEQEAEPEEQPERDPGDVELTELGRGPTKAGAVDFEDVLRAMGCEG